MKKKLLMIFLSLAGVVGILAVDKGYVKEQNIYINEVRCWDTPAERNGYYGSSYLELYNASEEEISLDGWYVSNEPKNLKKSQLHDVMIDSKGFVIIYTNGKADSGDSVSFQLSHEGEKIFLSDAAGNLVDKVYVPKQDFGTVYARVTDGAKDWGVKEETTDFSNNEARIVSTKTLETPAFSHESGYYEAAFLLTLDAKAGISIYYTLDGSVPTENSYVYTEPLLIENVSNQPNVCNAVQSVVLEWKDYTPPTYPVDKAVVVRAVAMDQNHQVSDVVTNTYLVGNEKYRNRVILSVVADFDDLFGKQGIFSTGDAWDYYYLSNYQTDIATPNFLQGGRSWEIQGNIEFIENGQETANQKAGIRTQGASTRFGERKRMSLFSREEYSENRYFENLNFDVKKSHAFSLNMSISNAALPELVQDRDVAVAKAKDREKATVFLNGEYWYDAYVLEKYNKYYLEETYDVNRDNVIILKNQSISEGPDNSFEIYGQLLGYVANTDLSDDENYAQLETMADMQSYIDYICANVYLCNMDMSETKNYLLWRTIENEGTDMGDGRWRWMIYDTDCLEWANPRYYDVDSKAEINSFIKSMEYTGVAIDEHLLYSTAKRNGQFCKQFVLSFLDMANVNFSMENVTKVFEEWNSSPGIYGDFFEKRFDYIVPYMAEEFGLTGTLENVTLKVNDSKGGIICLNTTTPDLSKGSWMGRYYTDYPVTVTAIPEEGYEFVGWSGSVTSDSATIEAEILAGGITLEAVFEKTVN